MAKREMVFCSPVAMRAVHLPGTDILPHLAGQGDQLIGALAHGAGHHRDLLPLLICPGHPGSDRPDVGGGGYAAAAVFMYNAHAVFASSK